MAKLFEQNYEARDMATATVTASQTGPDKFLVAAYLPAGISNIPEVFRSRSLPKAWQDFKKVCAWVESMGFSRI